MSSCCGAMEATVSCFKRTFLDTWGLLLTHFKEKGGYNATFQDSVFVLKVYEAGVSCSYSNWFLFNTAHSSTPYSTDKYATMLSQPLDWSCNHFRFLDFEEEQHLLPLGWWMLPAFCFAKSKLCPDLHREGIEAFPQNQRERRVKLRNWECTGKRRIIKLH